MWCSRISPSELIIYPKYEFVFTFGGHGGPYDAYAESMGTSVGT